ncbi:hypothetical protein Sjap_002875 [Stephania japonica]|uniref:Uncharacterized protein n=1 Tax=Stephania japonica TaxID=461633 RepID=A0AAP0PUJ0_9MAGN
MNLSLLQSKEGFVFESDRNHVLGKNNLLLMGLILDPVTGKWVEKYGHTSSSEEDDQDDMDQEESDVSGGEGTSVEIEYIDSRVEEDESRDGETWNWSMDKLLKNLNGNIDNHVGGGRTPITPSIGLTSSPLMLQEMKQLLEEHFHGLQVFMEAWFNQVDNMAREQSRIAEHVDKLEKKVRKLTDVLFCVDFARVDSVVHVGLGQVGPSLCGNWGRHILTKSAGDASYGLNLLHGDMETLLIHAQDLVEKTEYSRKVVVDFMEWFDALLKRYEEQLGERETRKKWKRTWKPDHVDLDANP